MRSIRTALIASLLCVSEAAAQQTDVSPIPMVDVPLIAWVGSRAHALPDTLPDFRNEEARRQAFQSMLGAIAAGRWADAAADAAPLKYYLVAIREADQLFIVASDDSNGGRDPIVVINTQPQRDLIAEAPHVPFEPGTGEQALVFLTRLKGRAALISGAHRCASKSFSTCDGKTEVCGSLTAYRDSDAGHNLGTLFHAAHLALAALWPQSVVMSLHGMMEDDQGVKTSLIISNGAHDADGDAKTAATKLRVSAADKAGPPGTLVSCNYPADAKFGFRKLCGYTNVQGRQVNGGTNTCNASVESGTGRFIHMEQDWTILRRYAEGWSHIDADPVNSALVGGLGAAVPGILVP